MKPTLLVFATLVIFASSGRADTFTQDFENTKNPAFQEVGGWNLTRTETDVSTVEVSTERAHSGIQAARLKYQLSDERRLNIHPVKPEPVPIQGDTLYFSMWVRGSGTKDFKFARLWMMDNATEDVRVEVPGLLEALAGTEWRQVRGSWKLSELQKGFFNPEHKVAPPLYWLGFYLFQDGTGKAQGTVFFDDLVLSDTPLPEAAATPPVDAP